MGVKEVLSEIRPGMVPSYRISIPLYIKPCQGEPWTVEMVGLLGSSNHPSSSVELVGFDIAVPYKVSKPIITTSFLKV